MGLADHTRLAVGARVMLRQNLCTRFGLTNGSMGTVVAIVYSSDEHPSRGDLPQAVVVDFDHYTGPGLTDGTRHVAVPVSVARGQSGSLMRCTRTQIPLILGYATTIHKAQGCTVGAGESVEYMTVDLGQKEYAAGLSYVAFGRAKTVNNIAFVTAPSSCRRLSRHRRSWTARRTMHIRLRSLQPPSCATSTSLYPSARCSTTLRYEGWFFFPFSLMLASIRVTPPVCSPVAGGCFPTPPLSEAQLPRHSEMCVRLSVGRSVPWG